jgi:hypothetical protein
MSDAFGALYINGVQTGLPSGGPQGIGPFAVPASGVQDTNAWTVNTATTVPVPPLAAGVLLVPPVGGSVAWSFKTISGDTGTHLDKALPTFINFDSSNMPANIYLTSAGSVVVVVQFL